MKLHLGCGDDLRAGFENLDARTGWRFEDGLGHFANESVEGITISHAMMYVAAADWPRVLAEFWRVLKPGGIVRITEDDCESDGSPRKVKPWPGAAVLTGPTMATEAFDRAGFESWIMSSRSTFFADDSLIIAHRAGKIPPYVFYLEAVKPRSSSEGKLFAAPPGDPHLS